MWLFLLKIDFELVSTNRKYNIQRRKLFSYMNWAAKNNIIAIKKLILYVGIEKYFKSCVLLWRFLGSFSSYNSKTNAVRKILIPDLESASKMYLLKEKIILGSVYKVKFYQIFFARIITWHSLILLFVVQINLFPKYGSSTFSVVSSSAGRSPKFDQNDKKWRFLWKLTRE